MGSGDTVSATLRWLELRVLASLRRQPNRSHRLRAWPVMEQYACVFLWHHPREEPSKWDTPDIFTSFPQFEAGPAASC